MDLIDCYACQKKLHDQAQACPHCGAPGIKKRIDDFRSDRLNKIKEKETPILLPDGPKLVLHLVPFVSFKSENRFDLNSYKSDFGRISPLIHPGSYNPYTRFNFDGIFTYYDNTEKDFSYSQVFRNGIIESVGTNHFYPKQTEAQTNWIDFNRIEEQLASHIRACCDMYNKILHITPPIAVMLSLLEVKYFRVCNQGQQASAPIPQNDLILPEIKLTDYQIKPNELLLPLFEQIWNAGEMMRPNRG